MADGLFHRFVDRPCTQASADHQQIPFALHLSPFAFQQVLTHGVAGQNDLLGGEETLHIGICHAYLLGVVLQ